MMPMSSTASREGSLVPSTDKFDAEHFHRAQAHLRTRGAQLFGIYVCDGSNDTYHTRPGNDTGFTPHRAFFRMIGRRT